MNDAKLKVRKCTCGADISFIKTAWGKFMPVEAHPAKVVLIDGGIVDGYKPHWASCPDASKLRKK